MKTLDVTATGAASASYTFDATGNDLTNMNWTPETFTFLATSASTTLSFVSTTAGAFGPALDNVAITDLQDYGLNLPIDTDAYNSIGGYVFGELGRLPKRGDTVSSNGYSIRVESVRENRIEAVRIRDRRVNQ